jgi:APA family basic amino acid/polyamine antiporter
MYAVGCTIGAGIFALTGIAVQFAGSSLFVSFALAGFVNLCSAFMYAELCSRFPSNGSSFTYVYMTFGELAAWIVGWYLIVVYATTTSGLARALASYFVGLLSIIGLNLPRWI